MPPALPLARSHSPSILAPSLPPPLLPLLPQSPGDLGGTQAEAQAARGYMLVCIHDWLPRSWCALEKLISAAPLIVAGRHEEGLCCRLGEEKAGKQEGWVLGVGLIIDTVRQ